MLHRLFSEIVTINRRKQELQKISIVATDVSFASFSDLGLNDEETYHLRTQSKMELLKQHLKQHLPEDYVYGGTTGPIHAILEFARKKLDRKLSVEHPESTAVSKEE
jgi:hypothetical protein